VVSWKSMKQSCVVLSSTETERRRNRYGGWFYLGRPGVSVQGQISVNANNQGSTALMKNPIFHDRSKHIDIHYHYARGQVKEGRIKLEFVPTDDMSADSPNHCLALVKYTCLRVSDFLMDYTLGSCTCFGFLCCSISNGFSCSI